MEWNYDKYLKANQQDLLVIPVETGIQFLILMLDSRIRGNDHSIYCVLVIK